MVYDGSWHKTQQQTRRGSKPSLPLVLLLILALLIAGGGVFFYTTFILPGQETPSMLYASVTSKTPTFEDPLDGRKARSWDTYAYKGGRCMFSNEALHTQLSPAQPIDPPASILYIATCRMHNVRYTNFAFQVQMTVLQGETFAGLIFRADAATRKLYRFYTDFYGNYNFATEDSGETVGASISASNPNVSVQPGHACLLTVIAQESKFYLYINGRYLTQVLDTTYSSGEIGVFAARNNLAAADVMFKNAKIWAL
jgi:hypothetical protein